MENYIELYPALEIITCFFFIALWGLFCISVLVSFTNYVTSPKKRGPKLYHKEFNDFWKLYSKRYPIMGPSIQEDCLKGKLPAGFLCGCWRCLFERLKEEE